MPRGVRSVTIEQELEQVNDQLKKLNDRKKYLLAKKDKEAVEQLMEAVKKSGKSPAELVDELAKLSVTQNA